MTNDLSEIEPRVLSKGERTALVSLLLFIGAMTILDVYEDWHEHVSWGHILPEVMVILFSVGIAAFLLLRIATRKHRSLRELQLVASGAKELAGRYQVEVEKFKQGITDAITKQLSEWGLTVAEQDVCLLLLKGFSLQEIATLREASERTVRHQASVIYRKSGLAGRAQLSAFFLEDLLIVEAPRN